MKPNSQIKSKDRVRKLGEVYTNEREVNSMLDFPGIKEETGRIASTFFEPACGNGNFLAAILERKFEIVVAEHGKSLIDFEFNTILALTSIYGVDISPENVRECRQRLAKMTLNHYSQHLRKYYLSGIILSIEYVLETNIICANTLAAFPKPSPKRGRKAVQEPVIPIEITEFTVCNDYMFERHVYDLASVGQPDAEPLSVIEPTLYNELRK